VGFPIIVVFVRVCLFVCVCMCVCFREWADMEAQRDERIEMGVALAASREKAHQASKWLAEAEENLSRVKAGELHVKSNVDKKLGEAKKRIELALAEIRDRHEEDMGRFESRVDKANEVLERARENYQRELAAKEAEVAVLDGKQKQNNIQSLTLDPSWTLGLKPGIGILLMRLLRVWGGCHAIDVFDDVKDLVAHSRQQSSKR
jgi:hypothetical protein